MSVVADPQTGLFPKPGQIELDCSCPDWAYMCKHVAAVLYGVGNRLDTQPELLFTLRDVDPQELIASELDLPGDAAGGAQTLADDRLADVFGIEFDDSSPVDTAAAGDDATPQPASTTQAKAKPVAREQSSNRAKPKPKSKASVKAKSPAKPNRSKQTGRKTLRPTGKSVARLRKRGGWTQVQLAERLGVSPASVARWEASDGRIKLQRRCLDALSQVKHDLDRQ
jgi:uncharacterized Zn finger protein